MRPLLLLVTLLAVGGRLAAARLQPGRGLLPTNVQVAGSSSSGAAVQRRGLIANGNDAPPGR